MKSDTRAAQVPIPIGGDLVANLDMVVKKSAKNQRGFLFLLLQIRDLDSFRKRRSAEAVERLRRDLFRGIRAAVHASQYVGIYQDGVGVVLEGLDAGRADEMANRLMALGNRVLREGRYNEPPASWTDMIYDFLMVMPNVMTTEAGWSVFPRDGATATDILRRAVYHRLERNR